MMGNDCMLVSRKLPRSFWSSVDEVEELSSGEAISAGTRACSWRCALLYLLDLGMRLGVAKRILRRRA
jgi:hypothetical protein